MNRIFLYTWLIIAVSQSIKLSRTSKDVRTSHPFLYFARDDVKKLQQKAETTHAHIAKKICHAVNILKSKPKSFLPPRDWNEFSSKWNECYGNHLSALSMYVVLNETDLQARSLALEYMDRLSSLSNWRVRNSLRDDVPVAHSLTGFATAFDFLYEYLSETQRAKYLVKIRDVTRELYENSQKPLGWWGRSYIQNHCATNFAALFIGSLVVSRHDHKEAERWKQHAHQMLNRTLFLLNFVVDGSLEEGVAYGSYTTRSLTQYIFLALRHLKIDLTRGPWLREHFWFVYRTILPGFKQTIGIADTNINWYYGPESQLVFLDKFVLKNGWGNWLAKKINENRLVSNSFGYKQSFHQTNSMLHTEFLFYNASLRAMQPSNHPSTTLHVFSDWGVATYGGGQDKGTFLAFKCSRLHGRAINEIVRKKQFSWLRSWHSFNPGHEHPDQGFFVYIPKGVPFITGTLYGPKYTWLNNGLVFGPSVWSRCFAPYSGQLGECTMWLNYKNDEIWKAKGEIITSSNHNDYVFMSGEMAKWYDSRMGLSSVYRSATLIKPTVLLLVDHIERLKGSPIQHMSAFFHNIVSSFRYNNHPASGKRGGVQITLNGTIHRIVWCNTFNPEQSTARIGKLSNKKVNSSFVNITTFFPPEARFVRVAYLLTGPGENVQAFTVKGAGDEGVHVTVIVNNKEYRVAIVTKHNSLQTRYKFLNFGGFAKVDTKDLVVRFGLDIVTQWNKSDFREVKRIGFFPKSKITFSGPLILLPLSVMSAAVFFLQQFHLSSMSKKIMFFLSLFLCIVSLIVYFNCREWNYVLSSVYIKGTTLRKPVKEVNIRKSTAHACTQHPPFVMYTSLPFSGVELLDVLFKNTTDFFRYHLPAQNFNNCRLKCATKQKKFFDLCNLFLVLLPREKELSLTTLFTKLMHEPELILKNFPVEKLRNALPAIRLEDSGWALRIQLIYRILKQRARIVIVIRDPRGWIHAWLKVLKHEPQRLAAVKAALDKLKQQCGQTKPNKLASEVRIIQSLLLKTESGEDVAFHKIFAHIWSGYIKAVIRATSNIPKRILRIVKIEDIMLKSKKLANRVYRFVGIPLRPSVEHRLQQIIRTGQYRLRDSRELINSKYFDAWKKGLTTTQIADIEKICSLEMAKYFYDFSNTQIKSN